MTAEDEPDEVSLAVGYDRVLRTDRIPEIAVGTLMDNTNDRRRYRWNGAIWETWETHTLTPYTWVRVGAWEVRNDTPHPVVMPVVAEEPRPGLCTLDRDVIISVRRVQCTTE